jgi:hypothetical protein
MDLGIWLWGFCSVGVLLLGIWLWFNSDKYEAILKPEKPREPVSTENPSPAVTTAPSRSTSAVPPSPSRTTIPGAQRVAPTPMTDRQLWEQIEYNTRMSADVLHRMWVVVVISMVLSVIGGIAMAAFQ